MKDTTPRPLRVLLCTARYFPDTGGTETHVYEVARRLAELGAEVLVLTTDRSGKLPRQESGEGFRIQREPAWPSFADLYVSPGVYRTVRAGGWDVVHCQGVHTFVAPLAMWAAQRAGIPFVVTFHTGGHSSRIRTLLRGVQWALLRPLLARAARLIGVSQFEADYFQTLLRLPSSRFAVIPNGGRLPSPTESGAPRAEGTLLVSPGRLERYKGHQRVIAALPSLLRERPDARLLILGAGPYEGALRTLAARCGVGDRVEIRSIPPSRRGEMAAVLARADLVTLLSEYEAHPIAAMEALALGRPVLGADTSGLREMAERGWIRTVPLASSPEAVAEAVLGAFTPSLLPPFSSPPGKIARQSCFPYIIR